MRLLRISLLLIAIIIQYTTAYEKRSIVPQAQVVKTSEGQEVVEGSGDPKRFPEGPDQESITSVHQGSGYPSDDEDDVGQGSGNVVEGSGAPASPSWQPLPVITTTSTTTASPSIQTEGDHVVGEEHTLQTTKPEVRQEVFQIQLTTPSPILEPQPPPPPPQPPAQPTPPSSTAATTRRPSIPAAIPPQETDEATPFHNMLKPGVFAAIVGGSIVGLLATVFIIVFIVYRMRKKDEGSYALDEPKARPYAGYAYTKASNKEFYA